MLSVNMALLGYNIFFIYEVVSIIANRCFQGPEFYPPQH